MGTADQSAAVEIEARKREFDLSGVDLARWQSGNLHVSHLLNAMSVFFPEGERFFIRSVRACKRGDESPALAQQIAGFIAQEANHGRVHQTYNDSLAARGYPVRGMERFVAGQLRITEKWLSAKSCLAITIALEHLTAVMANAVLKDQAMLDDADPTMAELWRWHAAEETEHKAVAFDVYRAVCPGITGYLRRIFFFVESSFFFWLFATVFWWRLVSKDGGQWKLRGWLSALRFYLISPGPLGRGIPLWISYFRPGFHPWDHDNRGLLERWKRRQDGDINAHRAETAA